MLRHQSQWYLTCLVGLLALLCGTASRADEQFSLEVPGDAKLRSSATLSARALVIVDAEGRRHTYTVKPEADSANGAYLGYYNAEARQFLRWPAAGEGAMYMGTAAGADVTWKKSLMQIRPLARGGRDPVVGRDPLVGRDPRGNGRQVGPMNLAALPGRGGAFTLAHVDQAGALLFYEGRDGRWKYRESGLRETLPPGSPLLLVEDRAADFPLVYAVSDRGELVQISEGRRLTVISGRRDPRFIPQTHLALLGGGRLTQFAAVDDRGQLWQIDPERRTFNEIEARRDIFEPGIPLAAVSAAAALELFLVDRRGNLVSYSFDGRDWSRPNRVTGGFASGGSIAGVLAPAALGRPASMQLAAVDNAGRLHVLSEAAGAWTDDMLQGARLPPGAPVGLVNITGGLTLSAVQNDGRWTQWQRGRLGWSPLTIADGFPAGAGVLLFQPGPTAFAIDRTGRVIAGRFVTDAWECVVCSPKFAFAPRLVRRTIVPNEPLSPVTVEFENLHKEELVLRVHNLAAPERPTEHSIKPGKSALQKVERDAGATLEEVYLVPGPLGEVTEEVHRHPLPPKKLYDVVVYANRVTSEYFDRTKGKKSKVPDEASASLVSLGVFPLPPGELLKDDTRFDVYREAQSQRNPGAAALIDGNPGGK